MAWMYILECSDGSYYVGSTIDIYKRLGQHQEGFGGRYASRRRPVKLVYAEYFDEIESAYQAEKQVQGWRREKRDALIRGDFDSLLELARNKKARE